jgi:hypothetical protein
MVCSATKLTDSGRLKLIVARVHNYVASTGCHLNQKEKVDDIANQQKYIGTLSQARLATQAFSLDFEISCA